MVFSCIKHTFESWWQVALRTVTVFNRSTSGNPLLAKNSLFRKEYHRSTYIKKPYMRGSSLMQKQCETPVLPPCYALGYPPILLRVLRGKFSKIILFYYRLYSTLSVTGESRTPFLHLSRGSTPPYTPPLFPLEEIFMTTFFRHYKNRYYQIVGEALDTRDDTLVVVYRTL
ncbi:DUF1653 domain-containing protein, partial [Bilophila wadsworthia]|uniref:DUF1653 domain-containing protein n=1 Tax=Bilophila wadsworthia TaxID=35833 RepID=UPI00307FDA98